MKIKVKRAYPRERDYRIISWDIPTWGSMPQWYKDQGGKVGFNSYDELGDWSIGSIITESQLLKLSADMKVSTEVLNNPPIEPIDLGILDGLLTYMLSLEGYPAHYEVLSLGPKDYVFVTSEGDIII